VCSNLAPLLSSFPLVNTAFFFIRFLVHKWPSRSDFTFNLRVTHMLDF
jgi:hypothetical protein